MNFKHYELCVHEVYILICYFRYFNNCKIVNNFVKLIKYELYKFFIMRLEGHNNGKLYTKYLDLAV